MTHASVTLRTPGCDVDHTRGWRRTLAPDWGGWDTAAVGPGLLTLRRHIERLDGDRVRLQPDWNQQEEGVRPDLLAVGLNVHHRHVVRPCIQHQEEETRRRKRQPLRPAAHRH